MDWCVFCEPRRYTETNDMTLPVIQETLFYTSARSAGVWCRVQERSTCRQMSQRCLAHVRTAQARVRRHSTAASKRSPMAGIW
jgi:hypothetical protein